ncbi:MAG TPA: DUF4359 domain-containing protein [Nitrospiraceae bacterium]|nr:DUF4359 domain-containing protein [Nitrospiraceae bacterium]
MKRRTVVWGGVATLVIGLLTVLGLTNPALSQYQEKILVPVAQERHSSSDALLASILQSLPMSTPSLSSSSSIEDPSGLVTVLVNRTKRDNYWLLSVYSTEFDYCQGNGASRSVGKAVGIAGRFYVIDSGMCAP